MAGTTDELHSIGLVIPQGLKLKSRWLVAERSPLRSDQFFARDMVAFSNSRAVMAQNFPRLDDSASVLSSHK